MKISQSLPLDVLSRLAKLHLISLDRQIRRDQIDEEEARDDAEIKELSGLLARMSPEDGLVFKAFATRPGFPTGDPVEVIISLADANAADAWVCFDVISPASVLCSLPIEPEEEPAPCKCGDDARIRGEAEMMMLATDGEGAMSRAVEEFVRATRPPVVAEAAC